MRRATIQPDRFDFAHRERSLVRLRPRRAFTFLEVLFAVIIMGVGFIMIAAMFPVAVEQQQSNVAEAAAVSTGRDAIRYIQSSLDSVQPVQPATGLPYLPVLPCSAPIVSGSPAPAGVTPIMPLPNIMVTGGAQPYATSAYAQLISPTYQANPAVIGVTANAIPTADRRYSWLGFYRRDSLVVPGSNPVVYVPAPYAQVWIVVAQSTTEGQTTFSAVPSTSANNYISVVFTKGGGALYFPSTLGGGPAPAVVAPNAFGLVLQSADANLVGQVVRLGSQVPAGQLSSLGLGNPKTIAYYLAPGTTLNPYDPIVAQGSRNNLLSTLFILGSPPRGGPTQDITITTGFVRINN